MSGALYDGKTMSGAGVLTRVWCYEHNSGMALGEWWDWLGYNATRMVVLATILAPHSHSRGTDSGMTVPGRDADGPGAVARR
eukprot:988872-Rhodomonas_salina.1